MNPGQVCYWLRILWYKACTILRCKPHQASWYFYVSWYLHTKLTADWEYIRLLKQKMISNNNQLDNKNCKPHIYRIRDKVLVRYKKSNNYEEPYVGPYPISQGWTNGNFTILWGSLQYCINIIWVKTYNQ